MTDTETEPTTGASTLVGDTAASALWTLASRATGFARVILIGAVLGPTYFGNLFQLANQLPWILFELAIGSLLYALLVPALVSSVAEGDAGTVERVAGGFLGLVLATFAALAVIVAVAAPLIGRLFAVPLPGDAPVDDFVRAAMPLVVLTAPQLVGYGVATTGQAVQQAMGRFALPAAASIAENVILIVALGWYTVRYGTGVALADIGTEHLVILGGGATLGVFVHAAIQVWGARRLGVRLRPRAGWTDPAITGMLRRAIPSAGTAVLNSARLLLLLVSANVVAGGVVAFQLAFNVLNLPVALGAKPVAYAALPRLSLLHQRGDRAALRRSYRQSIGLAGLLLVPAAAALLALGPLAAVGLAFGSMAVDDGRQLIALSLVGVAGAIVGEGLYQLTTAASYAADDPIGPLRGQVIRLVATGAGMGLALAVADGAWLLFGFALAMSVADLVAAAYLHRRIAGHLTVGVAEVTPLGRITLTAAGVFGLVGAIVAVLGPLDALPTAAVPALVVTAVVGSAALGVFAVAVRRVDPQVVELFSGLMDGRRRTGSVQEVGA